MKIFDSYIMLEDCWRLIIAIVVIIIMSIGILFRKDILKNKADDTIRKKDKRIQIITFVLTLIAAPFIYIMTPNELGFSVLVFSLVILPLVFIFYLFVLSVFWFAIAIKAKVFKKE